MITCVPEPSAGFSPVACRSPHALGNLSLQGVPGGALAPRSLTSHRCASRVLVRDAATTGAVVLLAHAEAYLPGRIDALAADAISEVVSVAMPTATGRQALADPTVTLVIDGVSEVPSRAIVLTHAGIASHAGVEQKRALRMDDQIAQAGSTRGSPVPASRTFGQAPMTA